MEIVNYQKCNCGAITVFTEDSSYSVHSKNFKKFFPDVDLRTLKSGRLNVSCCCNHCVNHWGLDLCGCGSGEYFGECDNNELECKQPMQKLDEYEFICGRGGFAV